MFYEFRYKKALQFLCSVRSEAMRQSACSLNTTPSNLAGALGISGPGVFKDRGNSPMRAAILRIGSVIEANKGGRSLPDLAHGVVPYLMLALASHAVRNEEDAEFIAVVLGHK